MGTQHELPQQRPVPLPSLQACPLLYGVFSVPLLPRGRPETSGREGGLWVPLALLDAGCWALALQHRMQELMCGRYPGDH